VIVVREDLLRVRLVAYRGLWDRFAAPGTLAAFVRAWRRRIPFLVDLDGGDVTLRDLLGEGLLQQPDVLVFLMTTDATRIWKQVSVEKGNVFIVERVASGGSFLISAVEHQQCGYYIPLGAAAADIPVQKGELLLYESVDVIQTLDLMKTSSIKSDETTEESLAFANKRGAVMMRVCDLVERELLLNPMRWIPR
jgi:hypothetical protein